MYQHPVLKFARSPNGRLLNTAIHYIYYTRSFHVSRPFKNSSTTVFIQILTVPEFGAFS